VRKGGKEQNELKSQLMTRDAYATRGKWVRLTTTEKGVDTGASQFVKEHDGKKGRGRKRIKTDRMIGCVQA